MKPSDHPPFRVHDLWHWNGTVGRAPYALMGSTLFVVKYFMDWTVSVRGFGRPWSPLDYLNLPDVGAITTMTQADAVYCAAMLTVALPFIWIGVVLSVKRLRDIGLPLGWVVIFFAPVINLLFFAVLSVLPERPDVASPEDGLKMRAWLDRLVPRSRFGSAVMSIALTLPAFGLGAFFSIVVFASYGWSLFVGLPFAMGLVSAMLYGYHEERSMKDCTLVAVVATLVLAAGLMIFALEGAICLIMAAPLAMLIAIFGGMLGYVLQRRPHQGAEAPKVMAAVWLMLPLIFGLEQAAPPTPPLIPVATTIDIDAPPDVVWHNVVSFSDLPEPSDWLFRTGISYPLRARIEGEGVGAVRHCEFTTGSFVEPITVWEPGRRLAFSVRAQPHPMQEWTFFENMDPAHLDGYFGSERGEFLLTPLPGGGTRLQGTTWYRHRVWPNAYWQQWSDWILHRIHQRVLRHVKALSET